MLVSTVFLLPWGSGGLWALKAELGEEEEEILSLQLDPDLESGLTALALPEALSPGADLTAPLLPDGNGSPSALCARA